MEIIRNVHVPQTVTLGGAVLGTASYKSMDVLVSARVRAVYPVKKSEELKQLSCGALVYDPATGEQIFLQGFDAMARNISRLKPGETVSAIGKVRFFRGERFNVHKLIDPKELAVMTGASGISEGDIPQFEDAAESEVGEPLGRGV